MLPAASINPQPAYVIAAEQLRDNPGQWEAYESKGNCVILAGPGSGKTKTLTIKMARVLNEDIRPPQGIACITYSTECARELKRRLGSLGVEERANVYIGTVHGFCLNNVIRPYACLAGLSIASDFKVPDEATRTILLQQALQQKGIQAKISAAKTRLEKHRRTYLDRTSQEWREKDPLTSELVECYEALLHEQGLLDFDDMVLIGLRLIEQYDWVRRALRARFPVLVVDEYQDLGTPLHQIVLQLCFHAGVRILAVGDPDQSIYGFAGANPALLRELAYREGIQLIRLKMNYRCANIIVVGSMATLGENRGYEAKAQHKGTITPWECPNGIEEQAETICSVIIPQALERRRGRNIGDIAVLYPDKKDAATITAAVRQHGIKYVGGDKNIRYELTPLTRWIEDCAAWCTGGWEKGNPRLSSIIGFWLALHGDPRDSLIQKTLREQLVAFLWTHRDPGQSLQPWLRELVSAGLGDAIKLDSTRPDERESVVALWRSASDPRRLGEFTLAAFGGLRGSPEHLNLVTLHSSKGLEFDVVIITSLDQGRIPYWNENAEEKNETCRLLYVGLTRARHEVHLVYSGWYENDYGRRFKNGPSEFLIRLKNCLAQK